MRLIGLATVAVALLAVLSQAIAAPKRAVVSAARPPESSVCLGLIRDYENASKAMAMNQAEGVGDDSPIRQSVREAQNNGSLEKARITLDFMHGNNCKLPNSAPRSELYIRAAMTCKADQMKEALNRARGGHTSPPSCDQTKWQSVSK
jgi:hypothetical protein